MGTLLSTYTTNRDNNFNLIRFLAATLVLYSHSYALTLGRGNVDPLKGLIGMTWGHIAVDIFFVTSGFLIAGSFFVRNNLFVFFWSRALRIFPALIVAILACVFIFGLWFTTLSPWEYITDPKTREFLLKNMTLFFGVEYFLPGVFETNPWDKTVNGSLWTLPYELKMYVLLAFVLVAIKFVKKSSNYLDFKYYLLMLAVGSVFINFSIHFEWFEVTRFVEDFTRLFSMFFIGAAIFVWRDSIRMSTGVFAAMSLVLLISTMDNDLFYLSYCLFLPYMVFYLAYVPSGKVRQFNRTGDYSYGIYIYAYPVQQSVVAVFPEVSVGMMVVLSFVVTLILSMLSWHLVEKKCLKMKRLADLEFWKKPLAFARATIVK
jgi:peptidoglycan/LPS O-acetylase OafA/YrhL